MTIGVDINDSSSPNARYVTWAPSPCRIRVTNPAGIVGPQVKVNLSRVTVANGGSIEFATIAAGPYSSTLSLNVPANGASVGFFVRGVFGHASVNDGDVKIEARAKPNPLAAESLVGTKFVGADGSWGGRIACGF